MFEACTEKVDKQNGQNASSLMSSALKEVIGETNELLKTLKPTKVYAMISPGTKEINTNDKDKSLSSVSLTDEKEVIMEEEKTSEPSKFYTMTEEVTKTGEKIECSSSAPTANPKVIIKKDMKAFKQLKTTKPATRNFMCPFISEDWDRAGYQTSSGTRVKRDIAAVCQDPLPSIIVLPDETNLMCVRAVIIGSFDTPYEGGFFHFYIRFGPQYPFEPPRVCSMSSYRFGEVARFSPNLYMDGTVCLSILNTWSGPKWSAANNLSGVLMSVQSLLSEEALCNEPGYEKLRGINDRMVWAYDLYVRHETIRVAVVATIKNGHLYNIPESLLSTMKTFFLDFYESYVTACEENKQYDGKAYHINILANNFEPKFGELQRALKELQASLLAEQEHADALSVEDKGAAAATQLATDAAAAHLTKTGESSSSASSACSSKENSESWVVVEQLEPLALTADTEPDHELIEFLTYSDEELDEYQEESGDDESMDVAASSAPTPHCQNGDQENLKDDASH